MLQIPLVVAFSYDEPCQPGSSPPGLRRKMLCALAVAAIVAATLLAPMARPAAHEGHDHGPPQAATSGAAAPRIGAFEILELVGILKGDQLVIYLDRFASNEPVTAATVAVTIGDAADAVNAQANRTEPMSCLTAFAHGGTGGLTFAITGESGDDLLIGTLLVPQAAGGAPAPGSSTSEPWRAWLANSLSQTQRVSRTRAGDLRFRCIRRISPAQGPLPARRRHDPRGDRHPGLPGRHRARTRGSPITPRTGRQRPSLSLPRERGRVPSSILRGGCRTAAVRAEADAAPA